MRRLNNNWVDENNNSWNCNIYTKEQALKDSSTLNNCNDCNDCSDCNGCNSCNDCNGCNYCSECRSCNYCNDCNSCSYCNDCRVCNICNDCRVCRDCKYCRVCRDCNGCHDCSGCSGCHGCHDYKQNPNKYAKKRLGSDWQNTCIYWDDKQENVQVTCGCFRGTISEFETAVLKKYNKHHGYIKFIKTAKMIMEIDNEKR